MLAVTRLGIVTPQQLAKNRRYAILIIAVVAMLLPGTDPITMLISMAPALPAVRVRPACPVARPPGQVAHGGRGGVATTAEVDELDDDEPGDADEPPGDGDFLYAPAPMIFDLKSGKRRRVVQVVFGFLAFIFFISFVGFGIGSDVTGGIFDALGIGGGSSSSDPQYEQQI